MVEASTREIEQLAGALEDSRELADDLESLVDVLLGVADVVVLVVDDDRRIRGLSRAAAERIDGAAVGKPLSSALADDLFDRVSAQLDSVAEGGKPGGGRDTDTYPFRRWRRRGAGGTMSAGTGSGRLGPTPRGTDYAKAEGRTMEPLGGRAEIALPPDSRYMRLARLMASGVATTSGLPLEEVEDCIAVDELCATLIELGDGEVVRLTFELGQTLVVVGTTRLRQETIDEERLTLSRQILDVVTDGHELTRDGDTVFFVARKVVRVAESASDDRKPASATPRRPGLAQPSHLQQPVQLIGHPAQSQRDTLLAGVGVSHQQARSPAESAKVRPAASISTTLGDSASRSSTVALSWGDECRSSSPDSSTIAFGPSRRLAMTIDSCESVMGSPIGSFLTDGLDLRAGRGCGTPSVVRPGAGRSRS